MPGCAISIAISTFDRAVVVIEAVRSALAFLRPTGGDVVVVDDASSDDTVLVLRREFAEAIATGMLVLVHHKTNQGVTAAKNSGFSAAKGDWVLFLDSDDTLLPNVATLSGDFLESHRDAPLIFFRCVDEIGRFVGRPFATAQAIALRRYLEHTSYGEVLVAVNKRIVKNPPYDADLRGYEGLGCARIIRDHGPAILCPMVVRRYNRSRGDRLSSWRGVIRRAELIGRGHFRLIKAFQKDMSTRRLGALICKAFVYKLCGIAFSRESRRHG